MTRCVSLRRFSIFISWVGVGVLTCSGWFVLRSILDFRVLLWTSFRLSVRVFFLFSEGYCLGIVVV